MKALADYRNRVFGQKLARIVRFGGVGALATLLYFCLATISAGLAPHDPALTSVIAYLLATPVSYMGHKYVSFRSQGTHAREFPLFCFSALLGICLAAILPFLTTSILQMSPVIGILLVCVAVPLINFLVLNYIVFMASDQPS